MASLISQTSFDDSVLVVLILIAILLVSSFQHLIGLVGFTYPRLAFAIDIAANTLLLTLLAILHTIFRNSINSSTIIAAIYIVLCLITLLSLSQMISAIGFCCSRNMMRLMQEVYEKLKFLAVRIGVRRPENNYVILSYRMDLEMGYCDGACAICLMEFEVGEECALLEKCDHLFHHLCLYDWLAISSQCPTCRQSTKDCKREDLDVATSSEQPMPE